MRGENVRVVRKSRAYCLPSVVVKNCRADFRVPKYLQTLSLGIVGYARKADGLKVTGIVPQSLHQPRSATKLNEISRLGITHYAAFLD
jgi:hypothetical protein